VRRHDGAAFSQGAAKLAGGEAAASTPQ